MFSFTREYVISRAQWMCEAGLEGCRGRGVEVHHIKSRARGGTDDTENLIFLCRNCHSRITDNKPGTEGLRTHAWQKESKSESGEIVRIKWRATS